MISSKSYSTLFYYGNTNLKTNSYYQSSFNTSCRSIKMFKKHKPDRHVRFSDEFLLWSAIKENDLENFRILIKNIDQNDVNKINQLGLTPLHQAVIENSIEMIKLLLEKNANVNCVDDNLWTPLHCSAKMGLCDVTRYLIENGANPFCLTLRKERPIDLVDLSNFRIVSLLISSMKEKREKFNKSDCNKDKFVSIRQKLIENISNLAVDLKNDDENNDENENLDGSFIKLRILKKNSSDRGKEIKLKRIFESDYDHEEFDKKRSFISKNKTFDDQVDSNYVDLLEYNYNKINSKIHSDDVDSDIDDVIKSDSANVKKKCDTDDLNCYEKNEIRINQFKIEDIDITQVIVDHIQNDYNIKNTENIIDKKIIISEQMNTADTENRNKLVYTSIIDSDIKQTLDKKSDESIKIDTDIKKKVDTITDTKSGIQTDDLMTDITEKEIKTSIRNFEKNTTNLETKEKSNKKESQYNNLFKILQNIFKSKLNDIDTLINQIEHKLDYYDIDFIQSETFFKLFIKSYCESFFIKKSNSGEFEFDKKNFETKLKIIKKFLFNLIDNKNELDSEFEFLCIVYELIENKYHSLGLLRDVFLLLHSSNMISIDSFNNWNSNDLNHDKNQVGKIFSNLSNEIEIN